MNTKLFLGIKGVGIFLFSTIITVACVQESYATPLTTQRQTALPQTQINPLAGQQFAWHGGWHGGGWHGGWGGWHRGWGGGWHGGWRGGGWGYGFGPAFIGAPCHRYCYLNRWGAPVQCFRRCW